MSTLTELNAASDWLKQIWERGYNLETRIYEAVAGPGQAIVTGDVLELGTGVKLKTVTAATGANAIAVSLTPVSLADSLADSNILCLVRGPAIIDSDHLAFSESDTQKAAAVAALAALALPILAVNSALATWTTQTT